MKLYIGLISNNTDNSIDFEEISIFPSTNRKTVESWILRNVNAILKTTFTNTQDLSSYLLTTESNASTLHFSINEKNILSINTNTDTTSNMPIIYVAKIYNDKKQIMDVQHYQHFENAIADISDVNNTIFRSLSQAERSTLGKISIMNSSFDDENNINDDFTIKFENNISVYIGQIMLKDIVENK